MATDADPHRPAGAAPTPPVLVVVFNRPEVTRQQMTALRRARPSQLFVAADGPRPGHPDDAERCEHTRRLATEVDWPCQVHTRFQPANIGLQRSMVEAITWFFEHVDAGIILEDDCIPEPGFFPYAGELLDRYADHTQVMHVSGLNMRPRERFGPHSYFTAEVGHIWGWATWARAWRLFDPAFTAWPDLRAELGPGSTPLRRALGRKFASAADGRKHTWSRAWYYTCVRAGGRALIPAANLVRNVGFGDDATHTSSTRHPLRVEPLGSLPTPLDHPDHLVPNVRYERLLARYHAGSYRRRLDDRLREAAARLRRG